MGDCCDDGKTDKTSEKALSVGEGEAGKKANATLLPCVKSVQNT
jgi:hypothetical protein